jgi:hypothetical protein
MARCAALSENKFRLRGGVPAAIISRQDAAPTEKIESPGRKRHLKSRERND